MSPVLQDKVAIITGAGRGLGKAFALRYAGEGAKLLLPDISLERAEKTAEEIRGKGGEAAAMLTDISDENSTQKMAEKVTQLYGRADILLNNAALSYGITPGPWESWTVELWDKFFAINARGTWLACKAIAPLMVKQGAGKIINIASNTIKPPVRDGILPYVCSKAAVNLLTQVLAQALGPSGITVNAIAPGATATEANLLNPDHDKMFQRIIEGQCLKRREEPADVVGTAVFLASKDADFITGQLIIVDGGTAFV